MLRLCLTLLVVAVVGQSDTLTTVANVTDAPANTTEAPPPTDLPQSNSTDPPETNSTDPPDACADVQLQLDECQANITACGCNADVCAFTPPENYNLPLHIGCVRRLSIAFSRVISLLTDYALISGPFSSSSWGL